MAAAQALDFRDYTFGKGVQAAHGVVRKHVAHLDVDRPLYADLERRLHRASHSAVRLAQAGRKAPAETIYRHLKKTRGEDEQYIADIAAAALE